MSEEKSAPLPWELRGQTIYEKSEHAMRVAYCGSVFGAGVCLDGEVRSFSIDEEAAVANAALIVSSVNSLPALVKALEEIAAGSPIPITIAKDALTAYRSAKP